MIIQMDICSICHESLDNNLYTLPECNHDFHINCIMHWWRAGHNKCPLCNNPGVNAVSTEDPLYTANDFLKNLTRYKKLRSFSRRKNAPQTLKRQIEKLKKLEERIKAHAKTYRKWLNSTVIATKTNKTIQIEGMRYKRKKWKFESKIRNMKQEIGRSEEVIPIIIAKRVTIN